MALALYLDDCAFSHDLVRLLKAAGHAVTIPAEVSTTGATDSRHFQTAIDNRLVLITKNSSDFKNLHLRNSIHPGLLLIYQDNDPSKDMKDQEVVDAIGRLESTLGTAHLSNQMHVLNHWRS